MSPKRRIRKPRTLPIAVSFGGANGDGRALETRRSRGRREGHWIAGTTMIASCYLLSLVVVERLFGVVKPKLLTIPWFAKLWRTVLSVRTWAVASFRRLRERTGLTRFVNTDRARRQSE
jgi:hypothetical protein